MRRITTARRILPLRPPAVARTDCPTLDCQVPIGSDHTRRVCFLRRTATNLRWAPLTRTHLRLTPTRARPPHVRSDSRTRRTGTWLGITKSVDERLEGVKKTIAGVTTSKHSEYSLKQHMWSWSGDDFTIKKKDSDAWFGGCEICARTRWNLNASWSRSAVAIEPCIDIGL